MVFNLASTSSLVQLKRKEFCDISNPDVATPPALEAFPGANKILAAWNTSIAFGVDGIFAPSETQAQPLETKVLASSPFNSFSVAHGKAISQTTPHGLPS